MENKGKNCIQLMNSRKIISICFISEYDAYIVSNIIKTYRDM